MAPRLPPLPPKQTTSPTMSSTPHLHVAPSRPNENHHGEEQKTPGSGAERHVQAKHRHVMDRYWEGPGGGSEELNDHVDQVCGHVNADGADNADNHVKLWMHALCVDQAKLTIRSMPRSSPQLLLWPPHAES